MEILVDHDCTKCKYYEPSSDILVRSYCKKCYEEITFSYCPCEHIDKDEQNLKVKPSILDKIRAEIEEIYLNLTYKENHKIGGSWGLRKALEIIDKYKAESENL